MCNLSWSASISVKYLTLGNSHTKEESHWKSCLPRAGIQNVRHYRLAHPSVLCITLPSFYFPLMLNVHWLTHAQGLGVMAIQILPNTVISTENTEKTWKHCQSDLYKVSKHGGWGKKSHTWFPIFNSWVKEKKRIHCNQIAWEEPP